MKKYTKGSCANICGRKAEDCGCDAACKSIGTCCTDYVTHNCDRIIEKSLISKNQCPSPCEMCDDVKKEENGFICNQCLEGWYIHNGKCFKTCPEGTSSDHNNVCKNISSMIRLI